MNIPYIPLSLQRHVGDDWDDLCSAPEMIGLIMRSLFGFGMDSSCLMVTLGLNVDWQLINTNDSPKIAKTSLGLKQSVKVTNKLFYDIHMQLIVKVPYLNIWQMHTLCEIEAIDNLGVHASGYVPQ